MKSRKKEFEKILKILSKYTQKAYFVGGSVRDFFYYNPKILDKILTQKSKILNLKNDKIFSKFYQNSVDFDIEVYDIDEKTFEILMQKLGAIGVGKSFFIYKFKNFDLSLPRTENKIGFGHTGFCVKICNDEKIASARRDFSVNALMLNIFNGEILDFYGGLSDLKSRTLRVVSEKTFAEDSLRVFRAVQFCARFDMKIEAKSLEIMQKIDVGDLSKDRISSELIKLFRGKFLGTGLRVLRDLGLFSKIFEREISKPECEKLANFLDRARKINQNEMLFLYVVLNFLNLNKAEILKKISLNSVYKSAISQPFFKRITPKILCEISLKIPLKNWLGIYSPNRLKMAKNLKIFDSKMHFKVSGEKFANLKGKAIGEAIKKEQKKKIKKYIKRVEKCQIS